MRWFSAIILMCSACVFNGCAPSLGYQVYETQSAQVKPENGSLRYSNDDITISYDFWDNRGKMHFVVYNKSAAPITIDMSHAHLIVNEISYDYETQGIIEIPPNSKRIIAGHQLNSSYIRVCEIDRYSGREPLSATFTADNSPLKFRNYFVYTKDGIGKTVIDHEFYVQKVINMSVDAFEGKATFYKKCPDDDKEHLVYNYPYSANGNFYLLITWATEY